MLQMMCEHPSWDAADLSSLTLVQYGGSPVQERVARAWLDRGVRLVQGYGMTEASPGVYMGTHDGTQAHPTSVGVPHFFTDVALLRDDRPEPVAGPPAELAVRGPHVFAGYWNRPEETAAAFVDGGWFRTGDVLRVDDDGWAHVVDRVKDMYISGGENVYPAEVEAVAARLDAVANCAVVGVADAAVGRGRRRLRAAARRGDASPRPSCAPTWKPTSPATRCPGTWSSWPSCRATPPARSAGWSCGTGRRTSIRSNRPRVAAGGNVMTTPSPPTARTTGSAPAAAVAAGRAARRGRRAAARPRRRSATRSTTPPCSASRRSSATPPEGVKAVVLDAEGEHFCAGLDLSELTERDAFEGLEHSRMWHRAFERMERGRLPVVAVLKGAVVGGGLELASATHLRVAEPSAFYALPEGQHGLFVGGGGSVRVPRLIGAHRMADMMLTGRVLDAQEGHALGLSHYLTGPGEGLAAGAGAGAEDRGQLPGHELRRAAGAAAHRRGQPDRGLPAGVADGRGRGQQRRRRRSACRRSSQGRGGKVQR